MQGVTHYNIYEWRHKGHIYMVKAEVLAEAHFRDNLRRSGFVNKTLQK